MEVHEFTLSDADGASHRYQVTAHPPDEGEQIVAALAALSVAPMVVAIGGMLLEGDTLDPAELLGELDVTTSSDLAELGDAIRASLQGAGLPKLRAALLHYAIRDGKQMRDPVPFGQAYARNYAEMYRACWEVARYNRFFPQLDMITSAISGAETGPDPGSETS